MTRTFVTENYGTIEVQQDDVPQEINSEKVIRLDGNSIGRITIFEHHDIDLLTPEMVQNLIENALYENDL